MYRLHLLIHSSIHGHLGSFHILAIVNNAAILFSEYSENIAAILFKPCFQLFGYVPRSRIAGSYDNSWRRKWQPTPVLLPGESLGQRSLVGYSPWGCRVRHN